VAYSSKSAGRSAFPTDRLSYRPCLVGSTAPSRGRHALGRLLLVGFAPLDLGCQGQRATSEVATRDNLARPGRPHGQGLGTADEVRAHWDGVGTDRSDRGCLCWHTVNSKLSLGECGWGGIASTHAWPPSYMAGSHPAPLAADQPCSSRLVVQADRPNHHNSRGSSGVKDSAHRHRRAPAGTRARGRPPSPRLRTAPSPVPA
jgi:hypothetical protein